MAQYYNRQYSSNYGSGGYQAPIISMYNPEEMGVMAESMRGRQSRFDAGKAAEAQELARIGDIETLDPNLMTARLNDFEGKLNDMVSSKYDGDYGAAANDIVTLIGKERNDPFYNYNKQKVEAAKMYQEDARRLGANFMATNDPTAVDYDQWKKGADFNYTPIDKNQIVQTSQNVFSTMANSIMNDPTMSQTPDGQYLQSVIQYGLEDPAAVIDFITNDPRGQGMVQQIYQSMPELQGLPQSAVMDAITQGAYSAIGQTKIDYRPNQMFGMEGGQAGGMDGGRGILRRQGYINSALGKEFAELNEGLLQDFQNAALEEIINSPELSDIAKKYDITDLKSLSSKQFASNPSPGSIITDTDRTVMGVSGNVAREDIARIQDALDNKIQKAFADGDIADPKDQAKYGIMAYEMDELYKSDATDIGKLNTQIKQVNSLIQDQINMENESVLPVSNKNKKALKNMTKDSKELVSLSLHPFKRELILGIGGENEDGKGLESQVVLKDEARIMQILAYLNEISPGSTTAGEISNWWYKFE